MAETNPKVLLVGPDKSLVREFEAAVASIADLRPVTHSVSDYRQGIDAARGRRPDIALVEMGRDRRPLKMFVEEVRAVSPETAIVAVFHPSIFDVETSESEIIIDAIREGVTDFLRRPLSSSDLRGFLERRFSRAAVDSRPLGKIATFFSNKGGVGKSTLSVNVACGLATRFPDRVLLVDASLQLGVCATMLDLQPETTLVDAVQERNRLDETLIRELAVKHHCGLDLIAAPSNAVEAAQVDEELISSVLTLARRAYDYVIVDTFPMLDRVMMAILDLTDQSFLVTESVVPTLRGAASLIETLRELGIPADRRQIVLNRYSNFAGNLKPTDVAQHLGQEVAHVIPYQKKLLVAANIGEPYVLQIGRMSDFGRAIHRMIDTVATRQSYWYPNGDRARMDSESEVVS